MAAPYIMPDGPGGRPYRLSSHAAGGKAGSKGRDGTRAKDEAWLQLQTARAAASAEELAELRAIERAGWRFNDKALRDGHAARFGRMTAEDMANQFNPPPFGGDPRPTAFSEVAAPQHAALWEHFRSITMEREAKVLERWAEHNRRGRAGKGGGGDGAPPGPPGASPEAALRAWARVSRAARAALKKANPHAVMELEHEVLGFVESGDPAAELLLDLPDGFGRLLVHGLCEFHGLLSATRNVAGRALVAVYYRAQAKQQQQQQQQQQRDSADAIGGLNPSERAGSEAAAPDGQPQQERPAAPAAAGAAAGGHEEITCADVLLALRDAAERGGGFGAAELARFVRSMHVGSDALSEDYVMV